MSAGYLARRTALEKERAEAQYLNVMTNPQQNTDLERLLCAGSGRVHFVGICGVGMAGLAKVLKDAGFEVDGCDLSRNRLASWLDASGIPVRVGHAADHVDASVHAVVRSTAVPESSADVVAARRLGIPVLSRGDVLAALVNRRWSVAVAGTHGKTTTATFTTQLLKHMAKDPSWCIGGESLGRVESLAVAGAGKGDVFVVEADESDGTLCGYAPEIAVVTNIEFDHMEHFGSRDAVEACFKRFVSQVRSVVVYGADDSVAAACVPGWCRECGVSCVSFGLSEGADIRATEVTQTAAGATFAVSVSGKGNGSVCLPVSGTHNVRNALAAIAVSCAVGADPEACCAACEHVGLPRRRFELCGEEDGIRVISDYAHHPTEIAALIEMARLLKPKRLVGVFQPHRYTRTQALGPEFPAVFSGVDELVLVPVYPASESPLKGGHTYDLYAHFRASMRSGVPVPRLARSLDEARAYLQRELKDGDTLLVIGAGDVEKVAEGSGKRSETWVEELSRLPAAPSTIRAKESLAGKTTFKVGGDADVWVEVETEAALAAVLGWAHKGGVPVTLLGGGSNVLVSDCGVGGIVLRLVGDAFRRVEQEGTEMVVGAGLSLAGLLSEVEQRGLGGLEFLEGIPGTLGGAVRMNAGARGHDIGEHILSIRCLNFDGSVSIVKGERLMLSYRDCGALQDAVATQVCLSLAACDPAVIAQRRAEMAVPRAWMRGLRSAGSVFRNPASATAGELLDRAGFKGVCVGGARVSDEHANVIVTQPGATASDVVALMEIMKRDVREECGIDLDPEIRVLGRE